MAPGTWLSAPARRTATVCLCLSPRGTGQRDAGQLLSGQSTPGTAPGVQWQEPVLLPGAAAATLTAPGLYRTVAHDRGTQALVRAPPGGRRDPGRLAADGVGGSGREVLWFTGSL